MLTLHNLLSRGEVIGAVDNGYLFWMPRTLTGLEQIDTRPVFVAVSPGIFRRIDGDQVAVDDLMKSIRLGLMTETNRNGMTAWIFPIYLQGHSLRLLVYAKWRNNIEVAALEDGEQNKILWRRMWEQKSFSAR